ncbi:MAG: C-terminal binding protein [Phycisphaerae bacterium]|nr:C-terminal binding protein [Phycisphaerae bacterium]
MLKVAVTDYGFDTLDIEAAILEPLGCTVVGNKTGKDPAKLRELVADADIVITQFAPVDAAAIDAMQKSRIIVRYGIGVDNVDLKAAAAKGIPVCNVPDYCIDEVADHTLALILAATRQVVPCVNVIKAGQWKCPAPLASLHALKNMTVGIVALGRIGREVASRLKPFKCRLIAFDPALDAAKVRAAGCEPVSMDELFAQSDLISLHCPSTEQTRYIINAQSIAKMKRGVVLVNASRGTLVKTADLIAALQSGQVSAAALDVTDPEPINTDSPLLRMDNVIITSHMASASPQASTKLRTDVAKAAALAATGQPLVNVVNGVGRR